MKRKLICYKTTKEIHNGTTTVVYGFSYFNAKENSELERKINEVRTQLHYIRGTYGEEGFVSRKIAKLCEGDNYDPKIGKKVAATKAEIKTSSDAVEYVEETIKNLEELKQMLVEAIKPTKERLEELKQQKF